MRAGEDLTFASAGTVCNLAGTIMKTIGQIALLSLAGILLSGCDKGNGTKIVDRGNATVTEPPLVVPCQPGKPGGRLVIASFGDPKTFNPITENESSSTDIIRLLFMGLAALDTQTQEVRPGLAHKWNVEADQKTWTFHLRKGVVWSDGKPLTADDVVFTWQVVYDPKINNVTADLFKIDGKNFEVTKVDDLTVKVVTPEPYAPFIEYFGSVPIIPQHVLAPKVAAGEFESAYGINTPPAEMVTCGPFNLKQFKPGEFTLLERNPRFFMVDAEGQSLPYLDTLIYKVVPDMNAMSLAFLNDECDVHENVRPDEYDKFRGEADKGKFKLTELGLGLERGFLWFNMNPEKDKNGKALVSPTKLKWFTNTKFRQAISYAMDRPSIVKSIYANRAAPNYSFVSQANSKWYNPDTPQYPFDLGKAKALLKEIGIEDRDGNGLLEDAEGNVIEFIMNTNTGNPVREKLATMIASDLKKLGVKLVYQPIEFNSLVSKINNTKDYECILMGLGGGGVDPASSMNVLLSNGFTHQWYPRQTKPATEWEARIDTLMNEQIKTLDQSKRKKLFDEVQHILGEQMPMIYTTSPKIYSAYRGSLGNVRPTALSSYRVTWNAEELFFK